MHLVYAYCSKENKAAQIVSVPIVFSRGYVQMSLIDVKALFYFFNLI